MRKLIGIMGLAAAALLAGCGGGGGSPGQTHAEYSIGLTSTRTSLAVNVAHKPPGIGVSAPWTAVLTVVAREGEAVVPGSTPFECRLTGIQSGALYYTDNDHTDADGNPQAFQSITLNSNSGGASFLFNSGDTAGTASITCVVTNPRDNQRHETTVNIAVGGATGMPASVVGVAQGPAYLGSKGNTENIPNNVALQVTVRDDFGQLIADPTAANVLVEIVPGTEAGKEARLLLGSQNGGQSVKASTNNGVATVSLSSGPERGSILLRLTVDRSDNNVTNGVLDPITQLFVVPVVHGITTGEPLAAESVDLGELGPAEDVLEVLEATGGTPCKGGEDLGPGGVPCGPYAYTWTAVSALPDGLTLSPNGILTGKTPTAAGSYSFTVRVSDKFKNTADALVKLKVKVEPIELTTTTVTGKVGTPMSYVLKATGGVPPYTWAAAGAMPAGLSLSAQGIISGTPTTDGTFAVVVKITDSVGTEALENLTITVAP